MASRARSLLAALALAACGGSSATDAGLVADTGTLAPADATPDATEDVPVTDAGLVGARPYAAVVPPGIDPARPAPLVILLHGYGASGRAQDFYFRLTALAHARGFLLALPDGTRDASGRLFWNATDACCDFARSGVDDVAYIDAIIDDMSRRHPVDARRVFLVGHSNGGYMAHRYACDRAPRVAGIVSLAGAAWLDAARCAPTAPVAVLQVHGTRDDTVLYAGSATGARRYPSARDTVASWARHDRCGALEAAPETLDLDTTVAGSETRIERHAGCQGGAAELWSIEGGGHLPVLASTWSATIYDWLMAHPRAM